MNYFYPAKGLGGGWIQTLAGHYLPNISRTFEETFHKIQLADKDELILVEARPASWRPGSRIILLVHGLTGSHQSKYMIRMTEKLVEQNYLVFRINLRGCGIGFGLAKNPYHSGRSEDTRQVIQWIAKYHPCSPVTQVGFSLGGNITLKMVGENNFAIKNLDSVIAVSPPVCLSSSADHIAKHGKLFEMYFVKQLCGDVKKLYKLYDNLPKYRLPEKLSIREFDDVYTAPRSGFVDAEDYYTRASAKPLLGNIKIPALILSAKNDPVVATNSLENSIANDNVTIKITESGGHLGYISNYRPNYGIRWMDHFLLSWIKELKP